MRAYWGVVLAILWKDLLLELRTKDIVVSVLVFSLLVLVTFNFAMDPTPRTVALVAPGVLWVAFVFGGVLGLGRSFALEKEGDSLHGLLLAPVGRDAVFFGKALSIFLFMVAIEVAVLPVFGVLFNLRLFEPALLPALLLATLGVATVGTVFSAMAVNTRSREVLLPLLFLPVVMPIIVAAVGATGAAVEGRGWQEAARWLPLLAVFDAVFLVVGPAVFQMVVEE